jgi:transposase
LPAELPRVDVEHPLADEDRVCPHHGVALERFDEVVSEQLDIIPATVQVLRHIRGKYRCPCCEGHIRTAPMTPQPIPKSMASPGLLAHIATAKFVDALPLYRQHQQLQRIGFEVSRTTLATWMVRVGQLVQPLINLLRDEMLAQPYLLMDETTVQVLKEPGKAPESKSYLWAQMSPAPQAPIVLFDYDPTRSGEVPKRLLEGFKGDVAHRRVRRIRRGGRRTEACSPSVLEPREETLCRCAEESQAQSEETSGQTAAQSAPRAQGARLHQNALHHRTPDPRQTAR